MIVAWNRSMNVVSDEHESDMVMKESALAFRCNNTEGCKRTEPARLLLLSNPDHTVVFFRDLHTEDVYALALNTMNEQAVMNVFMETIASVCIPTIASVPRGPKRTRVPGDHGVVNVGAVTDVRDGIMEWSIVGTIRYDGQNAWTIQTPPRYSLLKRNMLTSIMKKMYLHSDTPIWTYKTHAGHAYLANAFEHAIIGASIRMMVISIIPKIMDCMFFMMLEVQGKEISCVPYFTTQQSAAPVFSDEVYSELLQEARNSIHHLETHADEKWKGIFTAIKNSEEPMYFGEGTID
jgi:hypothetical protein